LIFQKAVTLERGFYLQFSRASYKEVGKFG